MEEFKYKPTAIEAKSEEIPFALISNAAQQTLSFDHVLSLICAEFREKPDGFIKEFCKQHGLPSPQLSYLVKNPEYCLEAALLVARILISLNYLVKMTAVVVFEEKDIESSSQEITYHFIRRNREGNQPTFRSGT